MKNRNVYCTFIVYCTVVSVVVHFSGSAKAQVPGMDLLHHGMQAICVVIPKWRVRILFLVVAYAILDIFEVVAPSLSHDDLRAAAMMRGATQLFDTSALKKQLELSRPCSWRQLKLPTTKSQERECPTLRQ